MSRKRKRCKSTELVIGDTIMNNNNETNEPQELLNKTKEQVDMLQIKIEELKSKPKNVR